MEQQLTGGATLEQFFESYNEVYGTNYAGEYQSLSSHSGYSNTLYFPHTTEWKGTYAYWLASPLSSNNNSVGYANFGGYVAAVDYNYTSHGVRPLVKLPAGVKAEKTGSTWTFSK